MLLQSDDVFDSFKQPKAKRPFKFNLINPDGIMVFEQVPRWWLHRYCKGRYLMKGQPNKKVWRSTLEYKGYQIKRSYLD